MVDAPAPDLESAVASLYDSRGMDLDSDLLDPVFLPGGPPTEANTARGKGVPGCQLSVPISWVTQTLHSEEVGM